MSRHGADIFSGIINSFDPSRKASRNRKNLIENMYYRLLIEWCSHRYKWTGLPSSIDARYLEMNLLTNSLVIFYFDTEYDKYFALRGTGNGVINIYDNPTSFTVLGNQMLQKQISPRDCVPIWCNYLRVPDWDIISIYASKMAEIDRTIEINIMGLRHPWMIFADETQRLSLQNAIAQVGDGDPILWFSKDNVDKDLKEMVQLFDLKIDKELITNLLLNKAKIWGECMTMLGFNNANQEKRERLVADEVSANDSQILVARETGLSTRQQAVDQIKEMYGNNGEAFTQLSVCWGIEDKAPDMPMMIPGSNESEDE